jgi:ubiquitin-conjugating enzyme E2 O
MDPLMRPLARGEVGVSFLPGGLREIVPESEYELVDRTFQAGDYCKRSLDDVRSGVVVSTHVQARLVHAISSEPVKGWTDVKDLRHATTVNAGDYVMYDDWIGQVSNFHLLLLTIQNLLPIKVIEVRIYRNVVCHFVHSRSFSTNLSSQHQAPLFGCPR